MYEATGVVYSTLMREYINSAPFQELAKIGKIFLPDLVSTDLSRCPLAFETWQLQCKKDLLTVYLHSTWITKLAERLGCLVIIGIQAGSGGSEIQHDSTLTGAPDRGSQASLKIPDSRGADGSWQRRQGAQGPNQQYCDLAFVCF
jgi:hypothetical protein